MKKSFIVGSIALLLGSFSPLFVSAADGVAAIQQINMTVGGSSLIAVDGPLEGVGLSLTSGATTAGASLLTRSVNTASRMRVSSYTTAGAKNKITATITEGTMAGTNTKLYVRFLTPANQTAFVNYGSANSLKNTGNVPEAGGFVPEDGAKIGDNSGDDFVVTLVDNMGFCWSRQPMVTAMLLNTHMLQPH